jgi:hypothetical protein
MVRKVVYGITAGLVFLAIIVCDKTSTNTITNNSPLVGTWNMARQINTHSYGMADTIESGLLVANKYVFNNDYSLSGTSVLIGMTINFTGIWSVMADSVTLNFSPTNIQKWYYSVSGNGLTMKRTTAEGTGTKATVEYYTK